MPEAIFSRRRLLAAPVRASPRRASSRTALMPLPEATVRARRPARRSSPDSRSPSTRPSPS